MASKPISGFAIAVAGLGACVPDAPERYVQHPPSLATLRWRAPQGLVASYDVAVDRWVVATAGAHAVIDAAPRAGLAGPDALRHALEVEQHATVALETRESLSDGFATTLVVHAGSPQRVTVIVRQLGNQWVRCVGDVVLCKSLKRG